MLRRAAPLLTGALLAIGLCVSQAQPGDDAIVEARNAFEKKDATRLAAARAAATAASHPLAMWADYLELTNRLPEATHQELEAFYARWPGSYVEDRLRNDWLLELGRRRDWAHFSADYPRFRMNDDREVRCYALLADHLADKPVAAGSVRALWLAQRDSDDGCDMLATAMVDAGKLGSADVWHKLRLAVAANRRAAALQAITLVDTRYVGSVERIFRDPARYLSRYARARQATERELLLLALIRLAADKPAEAAAQLDKKWQQQLPAELAGWAWAAVARSAALQLLPEASDHYRRALALGTAKGRPLDWPADTIAWMARAALRADQGAGRWPQVLQAIELMGAAEQRDPTWVYWKARALKASGREADQARATELLRSIVDEASFYGRLAAEDLGQGFALPQRPRPIEAPERDAARRHAGLQRALLLIQLGLRDEGVREWNFSLRGMGERQLLAAAQLACEREIWDRCINTSSRTRNEVDIDQRFPTPFRTEVVARAHEVGLDPAYVYGLIRQESRFVLDARSVVGASGLMQLMPSTARWTARQAGIDFQPAMIVDRDTNLALGTRYLKLVLDDFGGSQAMAAAAYNAGPRRPRRWREGPPIDAAAWAENIPFTETREYVKAVLANATVYAALLKQDAAPSLRARLGRLIGPRDMDAPPNNEELP